MRIFGISSRKKANQLNLPETEPVPLDGDVVVSDRQWRHTLKPHERRSRIASRVVLAAPLVIITGVTLTTFSRLTGRLEPLIFAQLELPSVAGQELTKVAAASEIAHAIAGAHWTAFALVLLEVLLLAGLLSATFHGLIRLVTFLRPRTRADLRVALQVTRVQVRTLMPAMLTAAAIYFLWVVGRFIVLLRGEPMVDPIAELGLLDSMIFFIAALILLLVMNNFLTSVGLVRNGRFPVEHLLRWLAAFCGYAAAITSLPLLASWTFQVLLPTHIVEAGDRLVETRLEERIQSIALEHDISPPEQVVAAARRIPYWRKLAMVPMIEDIATWTPLIRLLQGVALIFFGLMAVCQLLLAYFSRGFSRAAWALFALCNGGVAGYLVTAEAHPNPDGIHGLGLAAGYTVGCYLLMILELLANPTHSPRAAARGDSATLATARRLLQETRAPARVPTMEIADPVGEVYRQVGCSLSTP